MTRFAILLGGDLAVTPRLKSQIRGARVIAAASTLLVALTLGLMIVAALLRKGEDR